MKDTDSNEIDFNLENWDSPREDETFDKFLHRHYDNYVAFKSEKKFALLVHNIIPQAVKEELHRQDMEHKAIWNSFCTFPKYYQSTIEYLFLEDIRNRHRKFIENLQAGLDYYGQGDEDTKSNIINIVKTNKDFLEKEISNGNLNIGQYESEIKNQEKESFIRCKTLVLLEYETLIKNIEKAFVETFPKEDEKDNEPLSTITLVALLNELGIINFLREKYSLKANNTKLGNLLYLITGHNAGTITRNLSDSNTGRINDPYKNKSNLQTALKRLEKYKIYLEDKKRE